MPSHAKKSGPVKASASALFDPAGTGFLEAALAVDGVLTGTANADTFALRAGNGDVWVDGFHSFEGDSLLFGFSSWSDWMLFSQLSDGMTWTDFTGGTVFVVRASDVNSDGVTDTTIFANQDSITLLGLSPEQVSGWSLHGG